jgi:CheY-like chemotaxis protein
MLPPPDFIQLISHALNHLYDPEMLRQHELIAWFGLSDQPNAQSALREHLIEEIEKLKPAAAIPIESRIWRVYKVLQMRYVQQMDQDQTAHQLGVGVRHLRREQQMAIQTLATALYETLKKTPPPVPIKRQALDDLIEGELSWLKEPDQAATAELQPLLDQVHTLVKPLAQTRGIELSLDAAPDLPPTRFVPAALRQVLISMTTYAMHRLASGRVRLSAQLQNHGTLILISATSAGRLIAESESARAIRHAITLLFNEQTTTLQVYESPDECAIQLSVPTQIPVRILMIDDNADVVDLFKRYAYGSPYQIEHLAHPEALFDAIAEIGPDIIILDIMIPGIDGWELLGRLRQHPKTSQTPVIICSVLPEKDLAFALGATRYLAKPVSRYQLLDALHQISLGLI